MKANEKPTGMPGKDLTYNQRHTHSEYLPTALSAHTGDWTLPSPTERQKLKAYLEILSGLMEGFNFYYTTPRGRIDESESQKVTSEEERSALLPPLVWCCCHGDGGAGCERRLILSWQQTREINRKEAHMVSNVTARLHA